MDGAPLRRSCGLNDPAPYWPGREDPTCLSPPPIATRHASADFDPMTSTVSAAAKWTMRENETQSRASVRREAFPGHRVQPLVAFFRRSGTGPEPAVAFFPRATTGGPHEASHLAPTYPKLKPRGTHMAKRHEVFPSRFLKHAELAGKPLEVKVERAPTGLSAAAMMLKTKPSCISATA